jgi:serine/threonine protein kinase
MTTGEGSGHEGGDRSRRPLAQEDKEALLRKVRDLAAAYLAPSTAALAEAPPARPAAPDPAKLERGRVCTSTNEYMIRGKLGEGGMGVVYRATDQKLQRDVAFKVLLRPDDEDLLERFVREERITAALDHPNFVRILSSGYVSIGDRSVPFYTMPLIRGRTLERLVLRRGVRDAEGTRLAREYPLRRLLGMLGQLALTLQSAHDKRIIHRDLKPSNVLVGPYGDVYVTDLGLAKFLSPKPSETGYFRAHVVEQLAQGGRDFSRDTMLGTPYYMAPEQALSPSAVDERADVFGLGALLYFVLTGHRPRFREPAIDRPRLESRRKEILAELALGGEGEEEAAHLAGIPDAEISESRRALAREFDEVKGLLAGTEYYTFRLAMRECAIVPPREFLESQGGRGAPPDPSIEAVCTKALAKDPRRRYPSARAFWEAVHDYLERGDRDS